MRINGKKPTTNSMKIKLKSKELASSVLGIKRENEIIGDIHKELVEADKRHKKQQFRVQRLKEKGTKYLHKALIEQFEMGEFDYSGQMEVIDKDIVEVEIHSIFGKREEIEENMRESKKKKEGVWADPLMFTGHKDKK